MSVIADIVVPHLRRKAGITEVTDDVVAELAFEIDEVFARFEEDCDQPVLARALVHPFAGTGLPYYTLPFRLVSAITKLEVYTGSPDGWQAIDVANYGMYMRGSGFAIDYPAGFREMAPISRGHYGPGDSFGSGAAFALGGGSAAGSYRVTLVAGFAPSVESIDAEQAADDAAFAAETLTAAELAANNARRAAQRDMIFPPSIIAVIRDETLACLYERVGSANVGGRFDVKQVALSGPAGSANETTTYDPAERLDRWNRAVAKCSRFM